IDTKTGDAFLRRAGYTHIRGKTWDEAAFLADDWFQYFNYRSLAHLCAGIDYIFGPFLCPQPAMRVHSVI
ncbi:hypothetical protein ACCS72_37945, partial [Rhizobium ruizarguesonis]